MLIFKQDGGAAARHGSTVASVARLVYLAHGLRGSLYASLALAKRLQADGHEITFLSFRDVSADVEANGFDFELLSDGPEAEARFRASIASRGRLRSLRLGRQLRSQLIHSTEARQAIARIEPELMIIDAEMHAVILATRALEIPTILAIPWFSPYRAPGHPALHTELRPSTSFLGRRRIDAAWEWHRLRRRVHRRLGSLTRRAIRHQVTPFHLNTPNLATIRALADFHGVDLDAITSWRNWISPVMYPGIPLISYTAAEMDFPHETPSEFTWVGVVLDEQRPETMVSEQTRRRWETFRDEMLAAERPIIYASMGSMQTGDPTFYRRIVRVARNRSDWAVVLGLGAQADLSVLGALPPNVLALDYAPQLDVLRDASAAIHHAGIGNVNECAHFKVPSLVASSGFVDEPGCAARVDHHGLGLSIAEDSLDDLRLEQALDELLQDPRFSRNLAAMRTALDSYEANRVPEELVRKALTEH